MRKFKKMSMFLALMVILSSLSLGAFAEETYVVQEGDVLWKIAKQFGFDYKEIADYNDLADANLIYPGDTIKIPGEEELTIIHTNDMHGFFNYGKYDGMGAALMATKIKEIRSMNSNTLLLDAGDALQGNPLVTLSEGETGVAVMNALGYDAMSAGNHEFDYTSDRLTELVAMTNFPVLSANVKKADGSNFLVPYTIKEMDGFKVGIFGLSTPETTYKSHPDNTVGLVFEDPKAVATAMVQELEEKVDVIVALAHLGIEGDYSSFSVAEAVTGIDVIVDGHSHSTIENGEKINDTLVVQAGEKTKNIGIVKLKISDGEVTDSTASLFTKSEATELTPDIAMANVVEELTNANNVILNEVVANAPFRLDGEKDSVRAGETELGNLIVESLLDVSGADIAFTNGGGIRSSIDVGEVTKGDIVTVLPFGNTVRVIELTGADVIAALEVGVDSYPESKGAFPHIAGMTVEFDASKEPGSRVTKVMVGGVMIDETATYTLATNDFLVAGGDGYKMFKGKNVVGEYGSMDEVLIDYMNSEGFDKAIITDRMKEISNLVSFLLVKTAA